MKDIIGYPVVATDGKAGKVVDILFGDQHWRMRFLDAETKTGFHINLGHLSEENKGKKPLTRVLIEPKLLKQPNYGLERRHFPISITKEALKKCPSFTTYRPVEEKYNTEFRRFFRNSIYDDQLLLGASTGIPGYAPVIPEQKHTDEEINEHLKRMKEISGEHIHSTKSVIGYRVRNDDENLGYVSDLILNTDSWEMAYFVLDTKHGIPSKKYLLSMAEVEDMNWSEHSIKTKLVKDDLINERRYLPYDPVNTIDGHDYDYYGKPCLKELMGQYC